MGLGVLMEKDNTVKQAGGFIIQLMPFTDEKVIEALEKKISEVQSVTSMLNQGMTLKTSLMNFWRIFIRKFLKNSMQSFIVTAAKSGWKRC